MVWWHLTIIPQISVVGSVSEIGFPRKPFARFAPNSTNVLPRNPRCAVWFEFVRMYSTFRIKWLLSGVRYDHVIDCQSDGSALMWLTVRSYRTVPYYKQLRLPLCREKRIAAHSLIVNVAGSHARARGFAPPPPGREKTFVFSAFYFTGKHFVIFKKQNYLITFS